MITSREPKLCKRMYIDEQYLTMKVIDQVTLSSQGQYRLYGLINIDRLSHLQKEFGRICGLEAEEI
jgi:hypothetical protein